MLPEHTLNLSRLDPVAAYFELLIVASEIIEISVGAETSQISALVHARTRRTAKRISQEPLGRQGRTIVVAARDTVPGDKELADHASGNKLHTSIEYVKLCIGCRTSDRDRTCIWRLL